MRERRREAQPSGIKTFGSTFKNPEDERAEGRTAGQLLEAAGCRGLEPGRRPLLREARQLRREHRRGDDRRRARADGRGPAAGPRALRRRAGAGGPGAGRGEWPERLGAVRRLGCRSDRPGRGHRRGRGLPAAPVGDTTVARELVGSRGRWRRSAAAPKRSRSPPTATVLPWLPLPEEPALPELPLAGAPENGRLAGPLLATGARPRRRAGGAAALPGQQLLRRKRGRRRAPRASNCASATPPQAAEVEGGGGRARRPSVTALDYVDLHAPSRPAIRRLWAYASAHSLNPRPQGEGRPNSQVALEICLAGCVRAFDRGATNTLR